MTRIRSLALVLCSALLCLSFSVSNAQDVTGNLVYTTVNPPPPGAQFNWSGFVVNNTGGGGTSGGNQPAYNTQTGTFIFGYTQGTVAYNIAVNSALANAGSGIQVSGFNYSWTYYNQDFSRGSLTGTIGLTSNTGAVLHSYNYNMPKTTEGWTSFSGTQLFPVQYMSSTLGNLTVSFSGKDDRFWAGYYGPQIRDIDVRLKYSVDPCATNPAYSPTCPGFNNVVTTPNLVPNPAATASWGSSINNSFAINTAFRQAGSGLQVHGFEYGFYARANDYCAFELIWCFDNRSPGAHVNVSITNNLGSTIHSNQYNIKNQDANFSNRYVFPQSQQLSNLGNFNMTAYTEDNAVVSNMYSRALYTPDLCMRSPNSSPSCPGYISATAGTNLTSTSSVEQVLSPITATTTTPATQIQTESSLPTSSVTASNATNPVITNSTSNIATNSQIRIGEIVGTTATTQQSQSNVSVSQILNIIRSEQSRISNLEMSTAMAAVDQAKGEAEKSTAEAQIISINQQAQTVASNEALTSMITPSQSLGSGLQFNTLSSSQLFNFNTSSNISQNNTQNIISSNISTNVSSLFTNDTQTQFQQQTQFQPIIIAETVSFSKREERENLAQPQSEESNNSNSHFWSSTNPLNSAVNPTINFSPTIEASSASSVNKNVKPNDAAGGSDINAIAISPLGFDAYTQLNLQDNPFYKPFEIYRGQKNVDNARLLRQLSSDRLHQQLIEQQYNKD